MFEGARSILVVKLSSIGDVVQSLPVAAALRRRYPEAHIAWAVKPPAAEVVAGNPHLTETLVVGGSGANAAGVQSVPPLGAPIQLARALRERRFELALDMQGLLKSALIAYLSGARDRIGFRNLQEGAFLLNNRRMVPDRRDIHAVEVYLAFAEAVGAPAGPPDFTIATSEQDRRAAAELLAEVDNPVALIPGARWESKRWPPERFAAVAEALSEELGCTAVIVGGAGDRELAEGIAAAARSRTVDLTGKTTLKQLVEVFRGCRATISNETGPMYISAAAGTPTVAIFGPTDPNRLGPYGEGHAKVTAGVPCGPCRKRRCEPLRCMEAIGPEQVLEAARRVMGGTASGGRSGGPSGSA